jgi:hypothetical protein
VDHLRQECEASRKGIAAYVLNKDHHAATVATGGLLALESLLLALHPAEQPPPEPEEPFVDPAEIIRPGVK